MYRINFYPEYATNRRRSRKRTLYTGLLSALVAAAALLVGTLFLSAELLGDQQAQLRGSIQRLEAALGTGGSRSAELDLARELFRRRSRRIDWSPKLAALSHQIDDGLRLTEVKGRTASKGRRALLEIGGELRGRERDTQAVLRFVESLGEDRRITGDFATVRLGTIEWSGGSRFQVGCHPAEDDS
jgi:Tfp pilus assembly protein PilN